MRFNRSAPAGLLVLSIFASAAPAAFQYAYDDGIGSGNIAPSFSSAASYPAEFMWGNVFSVQGGNDIITTISVAFGRINAPEQRPVRLSLYQLVTPNDPRTATLVASVNGTSGLPRTNTFLDFAINPTKVTGQFFVAATMTVDAQGTTAPARYDLGGSANASNAWLFAATSLANLPLGQAPFQVRMSEYVIPAVFQVRATAIPTPASALALAGLVMMGRRRR
ncbi:MAG: hypothetical protein K2Y21_12595 [Phycisphaerales bacterium]|nr:hypothetical protein [Phycisphaerales bacterium]